MQIGHQRRPGRIEDAALVLDAIEVGLMRVPTIEGNLDKRHAALDEPAGEQAALAKQIAAVAVAQCRFFLRQIEDLSGLGFHHAQSGGIGRLVAPGNGAGMGPDKIGFQALHEVEAAVGTVGRDLPHSGQVFDLELPVDSAGIVSRTLAVGDEKRACGPKPGPKAFCAGMRLSRDAHEWGQICAVVVQLLGYERSQGREIDAAREIARSQQVGGPGVVAFFCRHRTNDGHPIAPAGKLGKVFADLEAGRFCGDLLVGTAIGMSRLQVPQVDCRRSTVHPKKDARAFARRVAAGGQGQPSQPARNAHGASRRANSQKVPPGPGQVVHVRAPWLP